MALPVALGPWAVLLYCPACGEAWTQSGTNGWQFSRRCWCGVRSDVPEDASFWDPANYPALVDFPDQAAARAAFEIGGPPAVDAIGKALVARASTEHDADS